MKCLCSRSASEMLACSQTLPLTIVSAEQAIHGDNQAKQFSFQNDTSTEAARTRHRRWRHQREAARDGAKRSQKDSVWAQTHGAGDGQPSKNDGERLGLRCSVDRISRPCSAGPPDQRAVQPRAGMGEVRLPQSVRQTSKDYQRRSHAGSRQLQKRTHALPRSWHGARFGHDRRWRVAADGTRPSPV